MDINSIVIQAQNISDNSDVITVIQNIVEYLQCRERELCDTLHNLDSDNIAEIDFGRTRAKNLN